VQGGEGGRESEAGRAFPAPAKSLLGIRARVRVECGERLRRVESEVREEGSGSEGRGRGGERCTMFVGRVRAVAVRCGALGRIECFAQREEERGYVEGRSRGCGGGGVAWGRGARGRNADLSPCGVALPERSHAVDESGGEEGVREDVGARGGSGREQRDVVVCPCFGVLCAERNDVRIRRRRSGCFGRGRGA